jgi:hypothetical protein
MQIYGRAASFVRIVEPSGAALVDAFEGTFHVDAGFTKAEVYQPQANADCFQLPPDEEVEFRSGGKRVHGLMLSG